MLVVQIALPVDGLIVPLLVGILAGIIANRLSRQK